MIQFPDHTLPEEARLPKEYIHSMPMIRFRGSIHIIDNEKEIKKAVKDLKKNKIVGFDTETRPSFRSGVSYPVSLLQLSTDSTSYIIQVQKTGLPDSLISFLSNKSIKKIGVAVKDDVKLLRDLRDFTPGGFIDLADLASKKGIVQTGLRALSARYLGYRVSKSAQTSNWARNDLTEKQKIYAATDSWLSLQIYPHLIRDKQTYKEEETE